MMRKDLDRIVLIMAILVGGSLWARAEEKEKEQEPVFTLDPLVVTATRYEKRDVDVPASTVILTGDDLKNTGAANLGVALSKVSGVAYKQFGPGGASMGTMINEVNIRGVSNGTLILVNGNPVSWRGKYNLDAIAVDNIERVEIVKSGGSVLYGSEAMGGVVNIIMKKKTDTAASIGLGNMGQQRYSASAGNDKVRLSYNLEKFGEVTGISESAVDYNNLKGSTRTDADHVEKDNLSVGYNVTDKLDVSYNYFKTKADYNRFMDVVALGDAAGGDPFNARTYTSKQHTAQLNYTGESFNVGAYFNQADIVAVGPSYFTTSGSTSGTRRLSQYDTREKNRTWGADAQKNWRIGDSARAVTGMTYQREFYGKPDTDYARNNLAVFGEWEQSLGASNTVIVGARETWTTGAPGEQNYSNFSASGQYVRKLGENQSLYAGVSQSFIMPTFAQMYGASDIAIANPGLKPQKGVNYEVGWKRVSDSYSLKAAVYHIDITDNISATWSSNKSEYQYSNEDFKNTGFELTCDIAGNHGFSYNWGFNYGDPRVKGTAKPYWDRKFGRVQVNGGVTYSKAQWQGSFTASYLGDRVGTPSSSHSEPAAPYLLTSLSATWQADRHNGVTLTIDNVFDRRDNLSHSGGSAYYATPFNFLLGYNYKF